MATCDVTQLMADAKCFDCLHGKQFDWALLQLLCDIRGSIEDALDTGCDSNFEDDFDDGIDGQDLDPGKWQIILDPFLYDGGTAIEDPGGDGSEENEIPLVFSNGWVQAELSGTSYHSIFMRYSGAGRYLAQFNQTANTITLYRSLTALASVACTFVSGQVFRLECEDAVITVKYNGVTVLMVTDPSPVTDAGTAGMKGSESLTAVFDNFEACSTD